MKHLELFQDALIICTLSEDGKQLTLRRNIHHEDHKDEWDELEYTRSDEGYPRAMDKLFDTMHGGHIHGFNNNHTGQLCLEYDDFRYIELRVWPPGDDPQETEYVCAWEWADCWKWNIDEYLKEFGELTMHLYEDEDEPRTVHGWGLADFIIESK